MRILLLVLALVQFGQRPPLSPAETLLEPAVLKAMRDVAPPDSPQAERIAGSDASAGEIVLSCYSGDGCRAPYRAARTLQTLIGQHSLSQPSRTIRVITLSSPADAVDVSRVRAALHMSLGRGTRTLQIQQSPWSSAGIADEVAVLFARHAPFGAVAGSVEVRPFSGAGMPRWDAPTMSIVAAAEGSSVGTGVEHASFVAAATAYFLATLPNAGAEALLSHLTVGAHARLAEDGRKAVAQTGTQQRAGADVLIMFTQAIEREQRRMRSFERFMPAPVDPMLRSRLADMEKGITSVWTSMGITNAPFVPAAERIRGRGGEDRRVPSRVRDGPLPTPDPPTAMLKYANVADVIYELGNFVDGKRSVSDIRDAVSAEFGPIALPVVVDYFERLARTGAVSIR